MTEPLNDEPAYEPLYDGVDETPEPLTKQPVQPPASDLSDVRMYKSAADVDVVIKSDWTRENCYERLPGEEFFHSIIGGEIYIKHGTDKLCLSCAMRKGLITFERQGWQRGG